MNGTSDCESHLYFIILSWSVQNTIYVQNSTQSFIGQFSFRHRGEEKKKLLCGSMAIVDDPLKG